MLEIIEEFIADEDGAWSTGEWAVMTAAVVALAIGLYKQLEVDYQSDAEVYFSVDGDTNLATTAINSYRRMFLRAHGCFGYGLTSGGDLDALGNAGSAMAGSDEYKQKTDPYCNPGS